MKTNNIASGIYADKTPEVGSEAEHFMNCAACGQAFDMRDLGQVFHHEELGHKPITPQLIVDNEDAS